MPLLGIYLEEARVEKDTCIPLFVAALFTIARTWKQPRFPLTDEWICITFKILKGSVRDVNMSNIWASALKSFTIQ